MPKTIMQKLQDVADKAGNPADHSFAHTLSDMAIEAIFQGVTSTAWQDYLKMIVGNNAPKQLARLTPRDPNLFPEDPPWLRQSAIYAVSNAVCASGTTTRTGERVNPHIDDGVAPED